MKRSNECKFQAFMKKCLSDITLEDPSLQPKFENLMRGSACLSDLEGKRGCCVLQLLMIMLFSGNDVSVLMERIRPLMLNAIENTSPESTPVKPRRRKVTVRRRYNR